MGLTEHTFVPDAKSWNDGECNAESMSEIDFAGETDRCGRPLIVGLLAFIQEFLFMCRQAALCNINCILHKEEQFFVITGSQLWGPVYIMAFQNY